MKKLRECPHCGHDTFYLKQQVKGPVKYNIRFDGEATENGDMHAYISYTGGKYGYCDDCHKRICTADGYAINQEG